MHNSQYLLSLIVYLFQFIRIIDVLQMHTYIVRGAVEQHTHCLWGNHMQRDTYILKAFSGHFGFRVMNNVSLLI